MHSPLDSISLLRNYKTKRASSYDKSGGNYDAIEIETGKTATLCDLKCAGTIKHIWITVACDDPMYRRNLIMRMYWDGEDTPSVESPLGDFFGQGWGENYNFISLPLAASPQDGKGLNCYFPMPFSEGARIEIENQSDQNVNSFYFCIDYEEHSEIGKDVGRFHALWNRELTDPGDIGENEWMVLGESGLNTCDVNNYVFADLEGKGHFVGINYYVDNPSPMWYGEGDDMWMVDGEEWPGSMHGTGTEDFFNSSWCPNQVYLHPYFGYARVPDKFGWMGRTHCYRFFIEDAVTFEKSLRASIEHGHDNCLTLDICTVAYWYQKEPHKKFPEMLKKELRQNKEEISVHDIHRWRHKWRMSNGSGKLWGNEQL